MKSPKRLFRLAVSATLAATMLLPNAFAMYQARVKADALYFRDAPNGNIISTLPYGTMLAVINNSTSWYKVAVNGREGYVSGSYVIGTPTTDFNLGTGTILCDTTVNFRSQPNTSSAVLASLARGTKVSVVGVSQGWYKVSYNGKTGYVHPDYITFAQTAPVVQASVAPTVSSAAAATSADRTKVLDYAAQFLGVPYVYGGSTPSGFDCSGFTSYVFKNTVGSIPRVAQAQFNATPRVSLEELLPGDLVFFGSSPSSISHVGIFVGDGKFIHSPHTGDVVNYDALAGTYINRLQGGGRVIAE